MPASDTTPGAPPRPETGTDLVVTDAPMPADIAVISDALDRFNREKTGVDDRRPLAVLVRDPRTRQVIGGLTGRTSLGLFFVDLFFLPAELRGSGLGGEILRQAEDEARARGCRAAVLYTISFQAPGFYRKQGWERLGEVPCDPPGTSRVFMAKELTARSGD
ncbi:GNAT family N-acetyltransferase [Streptomyces exfoliatus]|uniref:GNAT family N-acetyltransferase n=1 Tax=Streptomyces exfoliatus TaxID=1905 RepID=UPI000465FE99|nr:GNAT family N-acetyltransferase [Streptomyces exfoliatus]